MTMTSPISKSEVLLHILYIHTSTNNVQMYSCVIKLLSLFFSLYYCIYQTMSRNFTSKTYLKHYMFIEYGTCK